MSDKRYPCACCGSLTRVEKDIGSENICPMCGWQDNYAETVDPDYTGGPNSLSLNEARRKFAQEKAQKEE